MFDLEVLFVLWWMGTMKVEMLITKTYNLWLNKSKPNNGYAI
jgi:hypothetical protein